MLPASRRVAEAESLLTACQTWADSLGSGLAAAQVEAQRFDLQMGSDRVQQAARTLEREWAIRSRAAPSSHPSFGEMTYRRARLFAVQGDRVGALNACLAADSMDRIHFGLTARTLTERQALDYLDTRPEARDLAMSLDPLTFTAMPVALAAAAVLASYLPARRAAAVDPAESLRAE